jgi:chromosomal replication initiator protein
MSDAEIKEACQQAIVQLQESFQGKEQELLLFSKIHYLRFNQNKVIFDVPSNYVKDQILSRGHLALLQETIFGIFGDTVGIGFEVKAGFQKNQPPEKAPDADGGDILPTQDTEKKVPLFSNNTLSDQVNTRLNPDFTFGTFISGDENSYAYNAALAVSKNPGKAYNPLLIYGGVGLGKTHLMHAIGNIFAANRRSTLICVTAEEFTNEFTHSLGIKKIDHFKKKYRKADFLLIDDIHFFSNKYGVQDELFYTFEALYGAKKQIVFTCDRPISQLKNIAERLRSRFTSGLSTDLYIPSDASRLVILKNALIKKNSTLPSEIVSFLAENITTNVRDLLGVLETLLGKKELTHSPVTLETAKQQVASLFQIQKAGTISVETIQKVVADHYRISFVELRGKKRPQKIAFPRHVAIFIAKQLTGYSFIDLGSEFGGRDHTTIMHSYETIQKAITTNSELDATVQLLTQEIKKISIK